MKQLRISVRNLVEFVLREGDIQSGGTLRPQKAMLEGGRIHRKLQRSMGSTYRPEVSLSYTKEYEDFELTVWGRADGIYKSRGTDVIDEIKGTYTELSSMEEPVPVHLAQACCYAYMYASEENRSKMKVQLRYCSLTDEHIRKFVFEYSFEELKTFFTDILGRYYRWAHHLAQWEALRDQSIKTLEFPYEYRPGQQKLAADVYRTILRGKQLFVQAATGTGKTLSVIFPSVHALGEGLAERIFYLTAKTVTGKVAEEAAEILRGKGLQLKVLSLTAKEKICPMNSPECNPEKCPAAKGHYDRINDVLYEVLKKSSSFSREVLTEAAEKGSVCPYELQLDLASFSDLIIGDYNYAFDPEARLKRFFSENTSVKDTILLIDEAHNLVERAREMYSAAVSERDVRGVRRVTRGKTRKLNLSLSRIQKALEELPAEEGRTCRTEFNEKLEFALLTAAGRIEEYLEEGVPEEDRNEILNFYFTIRHYLGICDLFDEHYTAFSYIEKRTGRGMKLFCVNPAENLSEVSLSARSTVFFSATLLPVRYYQGLLTTEENSYAVYVPSPFDPANRIILNGTDVTSRYRARTPQTSEKLAEYLRVLVKGKKGKYMAYFPSYAMLESVEESFIGNAPEGLDIRIQKPGMGEQEKEDFLRAFEEEDRWLLGFCVMGGSFAEGIDLTGEKLIGAAVVGTGLPMLTPQTDLLKDYYTEKGLSGFDYAYRFPGLNKVLQAAGRVIRTVQDRGVILLLDDRFAGKEYRNLFPREWEDIRKCTLKTVQAELDAFWSRKTSEI